MFAVFFHKLAVGQQKQVIVKMDEDFLAEIDAAFPKLGFSDRASFIRTAIFSELQKAGVEIPQHLKAAPSRAGKGGSPSHRKAGKILDLQVTSERLIAESGPSLPFLGEVAAGEPLPTDFDEEVSVTKNYPKDHYVTRVSGKSMEPLLQSGDLIIVDARNKYSPANGRVCVVSDGTGSSVKKWNRRKNLFESLNPDYPDLEPTEDLVFQGYFVEKVGD